MGWADPLIKRTVERSVEAYFASDKFDDLMSRAIMDALRKNPRIKFVKTMQMQMLGCDPKMDPREAWDAAVEALRNFLADEEISFGDPRYDWSRGGAVTIIHEYEIHHWETAA